MKLQQLKKMVCSKGVPFVKLRYAKGVPFLSKNSTYKQGKEFEKPRRIKLR